MQDHSIQERQTSSRQRVKPGPHVNNCNHLSMLKYLSQSNTDLKRITSLPKLMAMMWVGFSVLFVYLVFHMISQKPIQLGSPNLTYKCSTMSPGNSFILRSKGQRSRWQHLRWSSARTQMQVYTRQKVGVESYPYPVKEGQHYINLNPDRLFVQQTPTKGNGSTGLFKLFR